MRYLKQKALAESVEREGLKKRIAEMWKFLNGQATEVLEYDEQLVRRLIDKVTIYEERFEVKFLQITIGVFCIYKTDGL